VNAKNNSSTLVGEVFPLVSMRRLERLLDCDREHLSRLANRAGGLYHSVDVYQSKSDKWRHLDCPRKALKDIQARIQRRLLSRVEFPQYMFGSVRGRSTRDNAKIHVGQRYVLAVDLKDCFPNTSSRKVFDAWIRVFGCSEDIADLLTKLTTLHRRLPQGTSTSPLLANLTLLPLYHRVREIARSLSLRFSFFVDDITLSGVRAHEAKGPIITAIRSSGHDISWTKVRLMPHDEQQQVTGIVVNRKVSNGQERLTEIRGEILSAIQSGPHPDLKTKRRIRGLVDHAWTISEEQGASLWRLVERLGLDLDLKGEHDSLEVFDLDGLTQQWRPCPSFSRHRDRSRA
jgi:hypothetical protein